MRLRDASSNFYLMIGCRAESMKNSWKITMSSRETAMVLSIVFVLIMRLIAFSRTGNLSSLFANARDLNG